MKQSIAVLLIPVLLFSQSVAENTKTIADIKSALTAPVFPEILNLSYKGTQDNYAVFYDSNGNEAWYVYRRNKFDSDAEIKIRYLTEGSPFAIKGIFIGMIVFAKEKTTTSSFIKKESLELEQMKAKHNIPVYTLVSYKALSAEPVIF